MIMVKWPLVFLYLKNLWSIIIALACAPRDMSNILDITPMYATNNTNNDVWLLWSSKNINLVQLFPPDAKTKVENNHE